VGKDLKIISNPHKQVILTEMILPRGGRLESHKSHLKCRRSSKGCSGDALD
jgi:hypothetical protein